MVLNLSIYSEINESSWFSELEGHSAVHHQAQVWCKSVVLRSEAVDTVLYSPRTTILIVQNSETGKKLESPLAFDIQSPKYTFAESLIKITSEES